MTEEKKLPVLTDDEVERRLKSDLPGWWHEGRWIRRKYNTDGWLTTLALVNTIGFLAEAAEGIRAIVRDRDTRILVGVYCAQTLVAGALGVLVVVTALDLLDIPQPEAMTGRTLRA